MISCFETVELRDGSFFELDFHLDLLRDASLRLGLPELDEPAVNRALDDLRDSGGPHPMRVRITWDDGARVTAVSAPMRAVASSAAVVVDNTPRVLSSAVWAGLKSNNYCPAAVYATEHPSADEVILVNELRSICGGGYSTLFIVDSGQLFTPATSSGCRPGVTRKLLLDHLPDVGVHVSEATIKVDDLVSASEAFICSTGRRIQPIGSVNGQALPTNRPITEICKEVLDKLYEDTNRWS